MELKLAKNKMERAEGLNHLMVTIEPEKSEEAIHKPIAMMLVLDVSVSMSAGAEGNRLSGSMYGLHPKSMRGGFSGMENQSSKLDYVKQASEKMVDMLKEGDMLGVVSFSDIATTEYPLTVIDQQTRFHIKDRLQTLHTKGSTNVSDGLELAFSHISETIKQTHQVKLLLLSDGEANYGICDEDGIATLVRGFEKESVSVSTIGVGADYNSYYMETIATSSGGMFYHLSQMKLLQGIFDRELSTMTAFTVRNLKLSISTQKGLVVEENLNGFETNEDGVYYVGHLYKELKMAFELATIEKVEKEAVEVTVAIAYQNERGISCKKEKTLQIELVDEEDIPVNQEVIDYVQMLTEAKAKKDMVRYHENRNSELFEKSLNRSNGRLLKMQASYAIDTGLIQDALSDLESNMRSGKMDNRSLKQIYADSYTVMRDDKED